MEVAKARITVTRNAPNDIGQRELFVALDGQELAIIRFGESVSRDVEPGPHLLRVHNTLIWKKVELVLQPGEHARFAAVNRAGWGTYAIASVLGAGPIYLNLDRLRDDEPAYD
ncbi:MAG: hypothetical protein ABL993_07285 [Vicinamibacterales bacterium]